MTTKAEVVGRRRRMGMLCSLFVLACAVIAWRWTAGSEAGGGAEGCSPSRLSDSASVPGAMAARDGRVEGVLFYTDGTGQGFTAPMRGGTAGMEPKILWVVAEEDASGPMSVVATQLDGPGRMKTIEEEALSPAGHYPSILPVDRPGCWTVSVNVGEVAASFVVEVRDSVVQ